jgi:hypothetical protein
VDADFASGKCYNINGSRVNYRYGTYGIAPGAKDFCLELEYKPTAADLDSSNNILVAMAVLGYFGLQNGKMFMSFYANPSESWGFQSNETFVAGQHYVFRYGRTFANGAFFQYSTNKGVTWTTCTHFSTNPMTVSGGRVLGTQQTNYDFIFVGRYWDDTTTYQCYGKIGYLKYIVGAAAPAYSGLIRMDSENDYRRIMNFGDKVVAMRLVQNTYNTMNFNLAQAAIMYPSENTSKVATRDQILRYEQSITQGRSPAFRMDLTRKSSSDPVSVQGYLVNFERK